MSQLYNTTYVTLQLMSLDGHMIRQVIFFLQNADIGDCFSIFVVFVVLIIMLFQPCLLVLLPFVNFGLEHQPRITGGVCN
jgi:hypothetical protein